MPSGRDIYNLIKEASSMDERNASKPVETVRDRILQEARKITAVDRNSAYGEPEDNFQSIAKFWNAHLSTRYGPCPKLDETDVALMMVGMKAARLAFNPIHRDSWVDVAGYAACGYEVSKRLDNTLAEM